MINNGKEIEESKEYEVEVRAFISEIEFESILGTLTNKFGLPTISELKTFLFRSENGYGRIRIKKGEPAAILTKKIGSLNDKSRIEINRDIGFESIDSTILELESRGLTNCSYLKSISYSFNGPKNQKLFLSHHSDLGDFLEVENLTTNKNEINKLHGEVMTTLVDLGLQELPADKYQDMMNVMYAKTLKPTEFYRSEISAF